MLNIEESKFIVSILSQLTINAADPKSIETALAVQNIIAKLSQPTGEADEPKKE